MTDLSPKVRLARSHQVCRRPGETLEFSLLLKSAALCLVPALTGTVALIVTRKQYGSVTATKIAEWQSFDKLRPARGYEWCVPLGNAKTSNQVTVFETVVKFALVALIAFCNREDLPSVLRRRLAAHPPCEPGRQVTLVGHRRLSKRYGPLPNLWV